jgi:hypothetical protein
VTELLLSVFGIFFLLVEVIRFDDPKRHSEHGEIACSDEYVLTVLISETKSLMSFYVSVQCKEDASELAFNFLAIWIPDVWIDTKKPRLRAPDEENLHRRLCFFIVAITNNIANLKKEMAIDQLA